MLTSLVILSVILSGSACLGAWKTGMRLERLERQMVARIEHRLSLLHGMQYNLMRRQGWNHEELHQAFPAMEADDHRS